MNRRIILVTLALCCAPVLAGEPAKEDKEKGFEPLFDGKSFEGWNVGENTPKSWKIEEGLLVLTGGNSHLFTKEEFGDFIVRF
ncbi:MAG: family 16 glycoside hydrolase, partial [Planctomycetota bacterium]